MLYLPQMGCLADLPVPVPRASVGCVALAHRFRSQP